MTQKQLKESLIRQLELQEKTADFYQDLVNDYVYYWNLKKKLIADIKKNGLRYVCLNGNGKTSEKPNESVLNLQKTTTIMLKILSDLDLKEPIAESNVEDDYL